MFTRPYWVKMAFENPNTVPFPRPIEIYYFALFDCNLTLQPQGVTFAGRI
jgi:hypothetical protein